MQQFEGINDEGWTANNVISRIAEIDRNPPSEVFSFHFFGTF